MVMLTEAQKGLVERILGRTMNPVDEGRILHQLVREIGSNKLVADLCKRSPGHVIDLRRLIELDDELQGYVIAGKISPRVATTYLRDIAGQTELQQKHARRMLVKGIISSEKPAVPMTFGSILVAISRHHAEHAAWPTAEDFVSQFRVSVTLIENKLEAMLIKDMVERHEGTWRPAGVPLATSVRTYQLSEEERQDYIARYGAPRFTFLQRRADPNETALVPRMLMEEEAVSWTADDEFMAAVRECYAQSTSEIDLVKALYQRFGIAAVRVKAHIEYVCGCRGWRRPSLMAEENLVAAGVMPPEGSVSP